MRLFAIVLAAGLSSRMRGFKPLYPLGRSTVAEHVIALLQGAGARDVLVVIGHRAKELAPVAVKAGARVVVNERYEQGMFTSVLAGVRALAGTTGCDGFFLLPVDIPTVRPASLARLARAFADSGPDLAYPTFLGERGHPPLIAASLIPDILAAGDQAEHAGGLRAVLEKAEEQGGTILDVPVVDEGVLLDMDTEAAYAALGKRMARLNAPSQAECRALLDLAGTPEATRAHCRAVARVVQALVRSVNRERPAGEELDEHLACAAALLHDVAKGSARHEQEGGRLLAQWGFEAAGGVVAAHRDCAPRTGRPMDEGEIVFLADKVVQGEQAVELEQRFAGPLERFGSDPEAREAILRRRDNARAARDRWQAESGEDLAATVRRAMGEDQA